MRPHSSLIHSADVLCRSVVSAPSTTCTRGGRACMRGDPATQGAGVAVQARCHRRWSHVVLEGELGMGGWVGQRWTGRSQG